MTPEPPPDLEQVSNDLAAVRRHHAGRLAAHESDRLLEAEEIVDLLLARDDDPA